MRTGLNGVHYTPGSIWLSNLFSYVTSCVGTVFSKTLQKDWSDGKTRKKTSTATGNERRLEMERGRTKNLWGTRLGRGYRPVITRSTDWMIVRAYGSGLRASKLQMSPHYTVSRFCEVIQTETEETTGKFCTQQENWFHTEESKSQVVKSRTYWSRKFITVVNRTFCWSLSKARRIYLVCFEGPCNSRSIFLSGFPIKVL
jgi:hypothetical protein